MAQRQNKISILFSISTATVLTMDTVSKLVNRHVYFYTRKCNWAWRQIFSWWGWTSNDDACTSENVEEVTKARVMLENSWKSPQVKCDCEIYTKEQTNGESRQTVTRPCRVYRSGLYKGHPEKHAASSASVLPVPRLATFRLALIHSRFPKPVCWRSTHLIVSRVPYRRPPSQQGRKDDVQKPLWVQELGVVKTHPN